MSESASTMRYCDDPSKVEEVVAAQLRRCNLLRGIARLGLAVSGGADSVALFHLLSPLCREAGIAVTILHLNHGLRDEADDEERFVRDLADRADLPLFMRRLDLAAVQKNGQSLEMAARAERMTFFQAGCAQANLDAVATGHQADDVAETLLLRLARGAGAAGLSGLRPLTRNGHCTLIRPLLPVTGAALRAWLRGRGLAWHEDASNRNAAIPRNFVRHRLLPELERTWMHDLRSRLCQSAETLREDDHLLETLAAQQLAALSPDASGAPLPIADLLREPLALQRRMLRLWLFRHEQAEATGLEGVESILAWCHRTGDWQRQLSERKMLVCRTGKLSVTRPPEPSPRPADLPAEGSLPWGAVEVRVSRDRGIFSLENGIGHYPTACTLSAAALEGRALQVRARQAGDRIAPTGMRGSKKIQDLFVDAKIPEEKRDAIPLVVCGGEIAWVPGFRIARRFAVPAPDAPSVRITVELLQPK